MKQLKIIFFILALSFVLQTTFCRNPFNIIFFAKEYPEITDKEYKIRKAKTFLANTEKKAKKMIRYLTSGKIQGMFSTYAGNINLSDEIGATVYPRLHEKPEFYYLITKKIDPTFMFPNTIQNFKITVPKDSPAEYYSLKLEEDKETKLYLWKVKKEELPKDRIIPTNTIVIFAKPKNIFVPTGVTLAKKRPQLILPDIYTKKQFNKLENALFALTIRQFFGTFKPEEKLEKQSILKMLKQNQ